MISYFDLHLDIQIAFPGLRSTLAQVLDSTIDHVVYTRNLLNAIKLHSAFTNAYNELDEDLQSMITSFMNGQNATSVLGKREFDPESLVAKRHARKVMTTGETESSRRWLNAKRQSSPVIYEDQDRTKSMVVRFCSVVLDFFWSLLKKSAVICCGGI
jgi:hypothetical protein